MARAAAEPKREAEDANQAELHRDGLRSAPW
jgi:hypothetical protein